MNKTYASTLSDRTMAKTLAHTIEFCCYYRRGNNLAKIDTRYISCSSENNMRAVAYGMLLGLTYKYRTALVFAHPWHDCPWVGYKITAEDMEARD